MIARPLHVVVPEKQAPVYDRFKARERVQMLTVREGTCGERWGSWATCYRSKDEPKLP